MKMLRLLSKKFILDSMKPIYKYYDYREYMRAFYEERKRVSAFSWREFSRRAGFSSPNYMKVVCDGKSRLSRAGVMQVAAAMDLVGFERDYFAKMVEFTEAKDELTKKKILAAMQTLARENKVRVLDGDAYAYLESWLHPVMRELLPMHPESKPLELARMCIPDVSAEDVRKSSEFLMHSGFLKKERGRYEQTEKVVTSSAEIMPLAIRSMHRQMAQFAHEAVDCVAANERSFSGVTMSISKESFNRIVEEMEVFRKKIVSIASNERDGDRVYRLNLQFFPMTKLKEDDHA